METSTLVQRTYPTMYCMLVIVIYTVLLNTMWGIRKCNITFNSMPPVLSAYF